MTRTFLVVMTLTIAALLGATQAPARAAAHGPPPVLSCGGGATHWVEGEWRRGSRLTIRWSAGVLPCVLVVLGWQPFVTPLPVYPMHARPKPQVGRAEPRWMSPPPPPPLPRGVQQKLDRMLGRLHPTSTVPVELHVQGH